MKRLGFMNGAGLSAACASLALVGGCKAAVDNVAPAPSASQVSAPNTSGAASAPKAKPWFVGGFSGQYDAKLAPVEVKTGALHEWSIDDGKTASGAGKLSLTIDDNGVVDGSSEGALGPSHASGKVEDDTLRVAFLPDDPTSLRGVLVAQREGDGFKGTMQASSSDSLKVRSAAVELKKQPN
jgi:hypothetical protein